MPLGAGAITIPCPLHLPACRCLPAWARVAVATHSRFTRGMTLLRGMNLLGLLTPVEIVVSAPAGGEALAPERRPALLAFSSRLRRDSRVAMVQSPVDLVDGWVPDQYQVFYKMAAPFW